tara:strand:- start:4100 stop:4327 length:228 start_codon:yes stop_codon:yes gene_type:complete
MKNKTKKNLSILLGLSMLPFAYLLWVADRIVFTLMPQAEHKKLDDWLNNQSVMFALTRVLTVVFLRYLIKWIFGY